MIKEGNIMKWKLSRLVFRAFIMVKNNYYENLTFSGGKRINVSNEIDRNFYEMTHWHPYAEILVSLCDGNEVTVNYTRYSLNTNEIIFVYSGDLHSVHYVTEKSFLVIQFPLELLTVMRELKSSIAVLATHPVLSYDPCSMDCNEIMLLISEIRQYYYSEDLFREAWTYSLLLRLFVKIGKMLSNLGLQRPGADKKTDDKNMSLIAEACLYITENCTQQLTLGGISHHIGMSKSHFAHLFRAYTDMTFIDFLTAERIKRAETFFLDPKMHIVDIAYESGFSSISSFNRSFRKVKGCSPTEFRKTRVD